MTKQREIPTTPEDALVLGKDDGLTTGVNKNPYNREEEPLLWAQYERGFGAGRSKKMAKKAIRTAYNPPKKYQRGP